nr:MAG TPA: hypothetical protein [Caudoviricetes sp.]
MASGLVRCARTLVQLAQQYVMNLICIILLGMIL